MRLAYLSLCSLLASFLFASPATAADQPATQDQFGDYPNKFIRIKELEQGHRTLETPVAQYENAQGVTVDLVGAVHVAENEYYHTLNNMFPDYEAVLYEMVGGEQVPHITRLRKKMDRSKPLRGLTEQEAKEWNSLMKDFLQEREQENSILLSFVSAGMDFFGAILNLGFQGQVIDYTAPNFVFADMSLQEFNQAQDAAHENLVTLSLANWLERLSNPEQLPEIALSDIFRAWFLGDNYELKHKAMHILTADSSLNRNSVLLDGRNAKCMQVLDNMLKQGKKNIAVFYGAAHLPGMHNALEQRGFKLKNVNWLRAWSCIPADYQPDSPVVRGIPSDEPEEDEDQFEQPHNQTQSYRILGPDGQELIAPIEDQQEEL